MPNAGSSSNSAGGEQEPLLGDCSGEDAAAENAKDWESLPWHRRPSVREPPSLHFTNCRDLTSELQVFWLLPPFCLFTMAFGGYGIQFGHPREI